jgi:hypothetical protein
MLKGELLRRVIAGYNSKKLTFEQALPRLATSKLLIEASYVRERLMARAAIAAFCYLTTNCIG